MHETLDWLARKLTSSYAKNSQQLFRVWKHNTIHSQTKIDKNEYAKITVNAFTYFPPDEGSCYVFPTRNNCCEILVYDGVNMKCVYQLCFKTPVYAASVVHMKNVFKPTSLFFMLFKQYWQKSKSKFIASLIGFLNYTFFFFFLCYKRFETSYWLSFIIFWHFLLTQFISILFDASYDFLQIALVLQFWIEFHELCIILQLSWCRCAKRFPIFNFSFPLFNFINFPFWELLTCNFTGALLSIFQNLRL